MTAVTDTFTAAGGTVLTSHTSDSGDTWSATNENSGTVTISSAGRIYIPSSNLAANLSSWTPASADYDVQADIYQAIAFGSSSGVIGRAVSNEWYLADYVNNANEFRLWKRISGTYTQLGSYAVSMSNGTSKQIRLRMRGTTIKVFVDGVERISVTDSALSAAGKAGVRCDGQAVDSLGVQLDNFTANADLGTTIAIGQASETDTANAMVVSLHLTIGQASETDTATVLRNSATKTIGQASETDTASAMGRTLARTIGQATETDTAATFTSPSTVIVIIDPDDGTHVSGSFNVVARTTGDAPSGVQFLFDGVEVDGPVTYNVDGVYTKTISLAGVVSGEYPVTARIA